MEQITLFKQFPLFKKLSEKELEIIASRITEKVYADEELICQQGKPGGSLYLIAQGTVAITIPLHRYEEKQQIVSTLTPGMFFGELSFFDGKECSADVHAKGEVKLLELKKTDYDNVITADPENGYDIQNKIMLNLISTIRRMDKKYSLNAFLR